MRRFATWVCLLALAFNTLTPLAHAAAMERAAAESVDFVCHAGQPADENGRQAPASDQGTQDHCPLCVLFTSHSAALSTDTAVPLTPPSMRGAVLAIPTTADTLAPGAESRAFNPRAPPVSA